MMKRLKHTFAYNIFILLLLFSYEGLAQKYGSNWIEDGRSNTIDSVRIEIDGKKIKFIVPKANGSILIFEGRLYTDLNLIDQELIVKLKSINPGIEVTPEYLRTLKDHPPRLRAVVSKEDGVINFSRNLIFFDAPIPEEPGEGYRDKNTFNVDKTWLIESGPWSFRSMLDSDTSPLIAFYCGLLDGLLEDMKMVVSIGQFIDDNTLIVFGDVHVIDLAVGNYDESFMEQYGILLPKEFSAKQRQARAELRDTLVKMVEYMDDYEKLKQLGTMVYDALGEALSEWYDETIGNNTPTLQGYQSGKLVYGLITSLVGVKELSLMLQGGRQMAKTLKIIKSMACFTGDTVVITNRGAVSFDSLRLGQTEFIQLNNN